MRVQIYILLFLAQLYVEAKVVTHMVWPLPKMAHDLWTIDYVVSVIQYHSNQ